MELQEIIDRHAAMSLSGVSTQVHEDRGALLKYIHEVKMSMDLQEKRNKAIFAHSRELEAATTARFAADTQTMRESIMRLQQRCRDAGLRDD